jgi:flagellar FliL protein
MATPDEQNQQAAGKSQHADSNPVIENKTGKTGKGKMKKLWVLSAALILLISGSLTFGLAYFKGSRLVFVQQEETPEQEGDTSVTAKPVVKFIFTLDPFLVNLADRDNVRFVKTSFQLGLAEEPDKKNMTMTVAAMRDSIITLLSSKTSEQILTPQGKEKLREQVRTRMNAISPGIKVLEVYIVDFVVQL